MEIRTNEYDNINEYDNDNKEELKDNFKNVCRNFMYNKCERNDCKFIHDKNLCFHFWKFNECKFNDKCKRSHFIQVKNESKYDRKKNDRDRKRKPKNTECFEPMTTPVDLRFIVDTNPTTLLTPITSRDVLVAPHVFQILKMVNYMINLKMKLIIVVFHLKNY